MTLRIPFAAILALLFIVGVVSRPIARADAPAGDGACFPACRPGFVCSPAGQCVSACNPACAAGQECTAQGLCVAAQGGMVAPETSSEPNPDAVEKTATPLGPDVKDRRLAAPLSWAVSAGIGGGHGEGAHYLATDMMGNTDDPRLEHNGPVVTGGFGLRKYFTRIMGAQARASVLLGVGDGFVFGVLADGTLRIGPFGAGFPLFLGGGPYLGTTFISSTSHGFVSGAMGSGLGLMGGGVAEVGFLFGEGDRLEIVLRTYVGFGELDSGKGVSVYPAVGVGYRL